MDNPDNNDNTTPSTSISSGTQQAVDNKKLLDDLRQLAGYLVKIGTNVNIASHKLQKQRLLKHPELKANQIEETIKSHNLEWRLALDRQRLDSPAKSLLHLAYLYPSVFLDTAALMSPGGYDERRFWWAANNYQFYLDHRDLRTYDKSPSRLLSDILCCLLTSKESKLITISALHLSVKHSDARVYKVWFEKNRAWIKQQIYHDMPVIKDPKIREVLRDRYGISEAESQLSFIDVDLFIERWNLTGLR